MKNTTRILTIILAVLPMLISLIAVFFILPDTVAAHFNSSGTVDRYGSKYEILILPAVVLGLNLLFFVFRKLVKYASTDSTESTEKNLAVFDTVILSVDLFFNALCIFIIMIMKNPSIMTGSGSIASVILSVVAGAMLNVIGNIMPKTRRNSFMGMRLSFCMDTDRHWYIANRAGGIAMVLTGVTTIAAGLILRSVSFVFVMVIAAAVFLTVAIIYSYVKIKRDKTVN